MSVTLTKTTLALLLLSIHSTFATEQIILHVGLTEHRNLLSVRAESTTPAASNNEAPVILSEGPVKLQGGRKGSRKVLASAVAEPTSTRTSMQAAAAEGRTMAEGQVKPQYSRDDRRLLSAHFTTAPPPDSMQAGLVLNEGKVGAGVLVADGEVKPGFTAGSDGRKLLGIALADQGVTTQGVSTSASKDSEGKVVPQVNVVWGKEAFLPALAASAG